MRIIGFSGHAGSGKTTAAVTITNYIKGKKLAFADPLKQEVADWLNEIHVPFHPDNIWGPQERKEERIQWAWMKRPFDDPPHLCRKAKTFRQLLQLWGTEYRRTQDPDYWLKKWASEVEKVDDLVVCDDVRYPNEAELIRSMGGIIVRIERPQNPHTQLAPPHKSELAMDDYDGFAWLIFNGGNLDEFKGEVLRMVSVMGVMG